MREVAVIGVGMTKWGELWDKSLRTIFVETALKAMNDANIDKIDSMYIGCMSSGLFTAQEHIASLCADYLGQKFIPTVRVESACASGGLALRQGFIDIASGMSNVVLVAGVEKMTDVSGDEATFALSTAADQEYEGFMGATFPALYAMIARAHMYKYGTTREQLAHVAVKNHKHGMKNPHAQFRMEVTVDEVINSTRVADPLNILDCSPITDGSAAMILCAYDIAKQRAGNRLIVKIAGSGHATDTISLCDRKDITFIESTAVAAKHAYEMAGVGPKDINLIELHDCFTIAEICVLEALGITEKGNGGKMAESGMTYKDGKIPVNVSGGLKSKGHPVGATGIAQAVEIVTQLRGEAGDRQVKDAKIGLTQNMGGTGGSSVVHILKIEDLKS